MKSSSNRFALLRSSDTAGRASFLVVASTWIRAIRAIPAHARFYSREYPPRGPGIYGEGHELYFNRDPEGEWQIELAGGNS
jgi:hypothetical protein